MLLVVDADGDRPGVERQLTIFAHWLFFLHCVFFGLGEVFCDYPGRGSRISFILAK